MSDMLSQAEIDALLSGTMPGGSHTIENTNESLTLQEIDALGEIGNIGMGTSATTLFTLLGQRVTITTPEVTITSWDELSARYTLPYVAVRVEYVDGLSGSNFLILKEYDAKIITDLMMGGEGKISEGELSDLHLSAISEAMNQMIGSSATSMSSMFNKRIEISPPKAFIMKFNSPETYSGDINGTEKVVKIAFKMVIGNLIDSEIMQLIPIKFAKNMVDILLNVDFNSTDDSNSSSTSLDKIDEVSTARTLMNEMAKPENSYKEEKDIKREAVNVQPVKFQAFDDSKIVLEKKNISLIMDVPLQVTVELGRTRKLIKDILEFGPGSIIELDKLAGEPVDILVNGKTIAKGEVVVIDESFGVRITDIADPSKRL